MATYVMRKGVLVEKDRAPACDGFAPMSDIKEFVTQDGTPITSRSKLRAYEQRTGTRQIGNDFAGLAQTLRERRE